MSSSDFNPKEMYPVFIILSHADYGIFPKIIKMATRSKYSHSAICIDRNFSKIFQLKAEKGISHTGDELNTGLWVGPYNQPVYSKIDQDCAVLVAWVSKSTYKVIKAKLDYYEAIKDSVEYDLKAALSAFFNIKIKRTDYSFFCSEFVAMILNLDKTRTKKKSQFVIPDEFRTEGKFHLIWEGSSMQLDPKELNRLAEIARQDVIARGSYDSYIAKESVSKSSFINSFDPNDMNPVYIILTHLHGDVISNAIVAYTHSPYSHAAICVDPLMKKIYQVDNGGYDENGKSVKGGLLIGPYDQYIYKHYEQDMVIYVAWVSSLTLNKMKKKLKYLESIKDVIRYDFVGAGLLLPLNIKRESNEMSLFCSEFVSLILNIDRQRTDLPSTLVKPCDFINEGRFQKVWEGKSNKLNPKQIAKLSEKTKQNVIARGSYDSYIKISEFERFNDFVNETLIDIKDID